jgi:ATP-binding cassette subfamily F protein uup
MAFITVNELSIGYRGPTLLDRVSCQIQVGQRIGLLGRNGAGKTTLLRVLTGDVEPDSGDIVMAPNTHLTLLPQEIPRGIEGTVAQVVAAALPPTKIEDAWKNQQRVKQILSRMYLEGDTSFAVLSSGMKRRVLLARALAPEPDVLLLDEPTNHLDIESIAWLERFLVAWTGTLIFVTHDRMFLRKLADRILEIDRGHLFDWSCDYETFLQRKESLLEAEEKQNALFDKRLAQEEAWIRQGIKARRTRNEGRVAALKEMRRQRAARRETQSNVRLEIQAGQRSGNLVAEVKGVSYAYERQEIVQGFSTTIMRGDKIGIMGPNGIGKTTLLKLLLGQLTPDAGTVRLGTNLQLAYFDQLRYQLDEDSTVQENVGEGSDTVGVGNRTQHVIGYLQKFLFTPERARTPIRFLSGGERNRVLLAKLFSKPANVIVLDEPTNDLDTETLEMLESRLVAFEGTVLLVSHDREFLNNVVTSTIVFEPAGVGEYVGGYDDWQRQRSQQASEALPSRPLGVRSVSENSKAPTDNDGDGKRRLKYKEQQELDGLPDKIEQLEADVARLHELMAAPDFYQQSGDSIAQESARLKALETEIATAYNRWHELEELGG